MAAPWNTGSMATRQTQPSFNFGLGIALGVMFGLIFESLAVGLCIGIALCVALPLASRRQEDRDPRQK